MGVFIYSIMVYGIANMLVYFNGPFGIINKFRTWIGSKHPTFEELFSCMFCLPTNVGIVLSIISLVTGVYFTPFTVWFAMCPIELQLLGIFFDGMYAGAITYLTHTIQQKIENNPDSNTIYD